MPNPFSQLPLTPEAVTVLKQVGVTNAAQLAEANVTELQNAFITAAKEGRFPGKFPSLVKIAAWVEQARTLTLRQPEGGPSPDLDSIPTAVVHRTKEKTKKVYAGSGHAAGKKLMELRPDRHRPRKVAEEKPPVTGHQVEIVPRYDSQATPASEELNPVTKRTLGAKREAPALHQPNAAVAQTPAPSAPTHSPVPVEAPAPSPPQPPVQQEEKPSSTNPFRSFDDYKEGRVAVKPLDRHSLKAGEDLNKSTGTEQESFEHEQVEKRRLPRWHIRGVKHPDNIKVWLGAFVTLTAVTLTLITAIGAAIFPFYLEDYRIEFALVFLATLLFGLIYLFVAIGMRCRVCSCHLFYSRRCLKNVKAHRILGAFPMIAQTIHMLLFRWFRCMYCGTAIRLQEEAHRHPDDDDHA